MVFWCVSKLNCSCYWLHWERHLKRLRKPAGESQSQISFWYFLYIHNIIGWDQLSTALVNNVCFFIKTSEDKLRLFNQGCCCSLKCLFYLKMKYVFAKMKTYFSCPSLICRDNCTFHHLYVLHSCLCGAQYNVYWICGWVNAIQWSSVVTPLHLKYPRVSLEIACSSLGCLILVKTTCDSQLNLTSLHSHKKKHHECMSDDGCHSFLIHFVCLLVYLIHVKLCKTVGQRNIIQVKMTFLIPPDVAVEIH